MPKEIEKISAIQEKLKRLEQYLAADDAGVDRVVEQTVDKLLEREVARLTKLLTCLGTELGDFEKQYGMKSDDFYAIRARRTGGRNRFCRMVSHL